MDKKMILFVIIAISILMLSRWIFPPAEETGKAGQKATTTEKKPSPSENKGSRTEKSEPQTVIPRVSLQRLPTDTPTLPIETRTVETKEYKAVISSRGGYLTSFSLKDYKELNRQSTEMLPSLPDTLGGFLALRIPDRPELEPVINRSPYVLKETETTEGKKKFRHFHFSLTRAGVMVEKTLSFDTSTPYMIQMTASVTDQGKNLNAYWQLGPGLTRSELFADGKSRIRPQSIEFDGNKGDFVHIKDVANWKTGIRRQNKSLVWSGIQTKFFAAIAIPRTPYDHVQFSDDWWQYTAAPSTKEQPNGIHVMSVLVPVTQTTTSLYIGPKSYQLMTSIRGDFTNAFSFGWLSMVVIPLYYGMKFIQQYVPQMGLCLLVLTLVINIVLFPLRIKGIKGMKKMQKLSPQIKTIQQKYKNQKGAEAKQQMNQEMMALYRESGVNPMGGCLPLLLQMPFLFAFNTLIDQSIEFLNQPFLSFWIKDMTAPDPYLIAPIGMGIAMVVQMKMSPQTPGQDAMQQKMMMYLMPVMMFVTFLNLSSGLVLYFFFSTVISVVLQKLYEKYQPDEPLPTDGGKKKK